MADSGIKKVVVKMDSLPAVDGSNAFSVRYRIISEDRNRASHWSPIQHISNLPAITVRGDMSITGNVVNLVWTDAPGQPDREAYDIFVKWDDGEFFHHGVSYMHNFSFFNQATSSVSVAVQLESYEKVRNNSLTIFQETKPVV